LFGLLDSLGIPDRQRSGDPPSENKIQMPVVFTSPAATRNKVFSTGVARPHCVRIASRLSACSLNLYKGISEVKVIDFLLSIKIHWPKISLLSHKLFFSALAN
jgi:hypothetical protein